MDLQAKIGDLEAQIRVLEEENRRLRRNCGVAFMDLAAELRIIVWNSMLPDRRVLRLAEIHGPNESYESEDYFCYARPPVLLHICKESRGVALKHFKPFFAERWGQTARPIYLRPKLDILYLDMFNPEEFGKAHPEINEIESIAIPSQKPRDLWCKGGFKGMTRLLLVKAEHEPWLFNRCCATVELLPDAAGKALELKWSDGIKFLRRQAIKRPPSDVQHIEATIGKLVVYHRYLD